MPHLELPTVADGSGRVLLFSFEELAIQLRELVLDLVDAPLNYGNPAGGRVVVVNCAVRGEALVGWNGRRGAQRPGDRSSKIRRLKSGFPQKRSGANWFLLLGLMQHKKFSFTWAAPVISPDLSPLATWGPAHQDHVHVLVTMNKIASVLFRIVWVKGNVLVVFSRSREPTFYLLGHLPDIVGIVVVPLDVLLEVLEEGGESVRGGHHGSGGLKISPVASQPLQGLLKLHLRAQLELVQSSLRHKRYDKHDFPDFRMADPYVTNC